MSTTNSYRLRRSFAASAEEVFRFFVEPAAFAQWFVVPGFRTETVAVDARPGGSVRAVMVADDNSTELPFTVGFGDLEPPRRVVLRPGDDEEVTITLSAGPGGTELTYDYTGPAADRSDQAAVDAMLDQIARHL